MKAHLQCPPDPCDEAMCQPVAMTISYVMRLEAVQRVRIDGATETSYESRLTPVLIPEPDDDSDFEDSDEPPF